MNRQTATTRKRARELPEVDAVDLTEGENNPGTLLSSVTTYQKAKRRALFQDNSHADVIFKCPR